MSHIVCRDSSKKKQIYTHMYIEDNGNFENNNGTDS